ncbi:hypothetical protein BCEN4_740148 [Burkholderia cenocepacia]|nr:hypothetical protein BCEN4_740148 [Burkholderia cenocepacia]
MQFLQTFAPTEKQEQNKQQKLFKTKAGSIRLVLQQVNYLPVVTLSLLMLDCHLDKLRKTKDDMASTSEHQAQVKQPHLRTS